jgi:hypothetical protein
MEKLIAIWAPSQDISLDQPRSIRWADGSKATLDAYIEHSVGTRILREDHPDRIELHMYPDVVGDVTYDVFAGSWVVKDAGLGGFSLEVADPQAKDEELIGALSALPVVYRAQIRR